MFTTRPELLGTVGMVASTHWLASAAGMAMLEKGGNAFDAAVAAGLVLQVVEPHLCGPGGEVPILLHHAESGLTRVICGQGTAPQAATIRAYRDLGLDLVPGAGLLAAVVPGAFDAWMILLRDYGRLGLAEVMEPAIHYAEHGFPVVPAMAATIDAVAPLFLAEWPGSAAIWLIRGGAPAAGSRFRNPVLAQTCMRLLAESAVAGADRAAQIGAARRAWYRGFVAESIDRFCRTQALIDSSGRRHGGLLTGDDMVEWQAAYEVPVSYEYHGHLVCKTGPWGQGPVLLQQLALLKGFDLAAMDPLGDGFVHTVIEAAKLAFADREAWYGDPYFTDVPLGELLSEEYNLERRALIAETASLDLRPGPLPGRDARLIVPGAKPAEDDEPDIAMGAGEPTLARAPRSAAAMRGDTCHVSTVDRHGNMVSATPSGGWLQSSPAIPDLGFCLTTRAQMFWLEPDVPAALAPGRRPRTTLSPTLVLREGRACLGFGTPGGDQQDQWQLVMFLRHLHHGLNLQQAIDAPAFHTAHFPSSFWPRHADPGHLALETRFPERTLAALARRGHRIERAGDWALGRLSAVARAESPEGALLKAAANPRLMQGYAVGR